MVRAKIPQLASATTLLLAGARGAALKSQGCAALDITTANDNNALDPNSPELCAAYCNKNGYSYLALSLQYANPHCFMILRN